MKTYEEYKKESISEASIPKMDKSASIDKLYKRAEGILAAAKDGMDEAKRVGKIAEAFIKEFTSKYKVDTIYFKPFFGSGTPRYTVAFDMKDAPEPIVKQDFFKYVSSADKRTNTLTFELKV